MDNKTQIKALEMRVADLEETVKYLIVSGRIILAMVNHLADSHIKTENEEIASMIGMIVKRVG
jgi:hypothetical protein